MKITEENTTEVKPELFIQDLGNGKYRRVYPLKWKGKSRLKTEIKNIFTLRTIFTIAIILFVAWSYQHDVATYKSFYVTFWNSPIQICQDIMSASNPNTLCSSYGGSDSVCNNLSIINLSNG